MAQVGPGERAVAVRVQGRVQGVGYRAFTQEQATALGVHGWVVNRDDGSVEAALHGPGAALGDLIGRLRQGPPTAKVELLDVQSVDRGRLVEVPRDGYTF